MSTYTSEPGTLLAGRYRLVDQTSVGPGWAFWKATDEPLARSVTVLTFASGFPRITEAITAARAASRLGDPRFFPGVGGGGARGVGLRVAGGRAGGSRRTPAAPGSGPPPGAPPPWAPPPWAPTPWAPPPGPPIRGAGPGCPPRLRATGRRSPRARCPRPSRPTSTP